MCLYSFGSTCYTDHCEPLLVVWSMRMPRSSMERGMQMLIVSNALCVLYPGSVSLSSAATAPALGPLTACAQNTIPFLQRDIVHVPLAEGRTGSGNVLQTTSNGKEGYVVIEGGADGRLILPCQIYAKELGGVRIFIAFFGEVKKRRTKKTLTSITLAAKTSRG